MTGRSTVHVAVVSRRPPAGPLRRSALAGGLAIALIVLATSPGGADPQGGTGRPASVVLSQPVIRAVDHAVPEAEQASEAQPMGRAATLGADLEAAREVESAALAALAEASTALDEARDARDAALSWAESAQDELMRARIRLGDLIAAEEAAGADLRDAVGRVEGERQGSKAHRSAFTGWQMAAVAERAAHLRRAVAARVGLERYEQLQLAEAELTDAEVGLARATSATLKAARAAEAASSRVTQLEAGTGAPDPPLTEHPADASREWPVASRTAHEAPR